MRNYLLLIIEYLLKGCGSETRFNRGERVKIALRITNDA